MSLISVNSALASTFLHQFTRRKVQEALLIGALLGFLTLVLAFAFTTLNRKGRETARIISRVVRKVSAGRPFEVALLGGFDFQLGPQDSMHQVLHIRLNDSIRPKEKDALMRLPSLEEYLSRYRAGDRDRYLVVMRGDWPDVRVLLTEPVVYSDETVTILHHAPDPNSYQLPVKNHEEV